METQASASKFMADQRRRKFACAGTIEAGTHHGIPRRYRNDASRLLDKYALRCEQ
jgi:hypothetical protein